MSVEFWGGFFAGVVLMVILWGFSSRTKPHPTDYKWSDKNWHPDYMEPRKAPRVLKKLGKK